jgi:dipeptidyl aminopeptidase/acylaminoacyl peptidase
VSSFRLPLPLFLTIAILALSARVGSAQIEATDIDGSKKPLDTRAAIETTRFETNGNRETEGSAIVLASPNGTRYVSRLVRGDVSRDGVWNEIVVGRFAPAKDIRPAEIVARLFTRGYESAPRERDLLSGASNPIVWLDDKHVALLWENSANLSQVVSVDVDTHETTYLTHYESDVAAFFKGPRHQILCVVAEEDNKPQTEDGGPYGGDYVESVDALSLATGDLHDRGLFAHLYDRQLFVLDLANETQVKLDVEWRTPYTAQAVEPLWSPDGRHVLIDAWARKPPDAWRARAGRPDSSVVNRVVRDALENSESWFGRQLTRLYVVNLKDGSALPLWDAPAELLSDNAIPAAWSPDGRSIALASVIPPPQLQGPSADFSHEIAAEVNLSTGRVRQLPLDEEMRAHTRSLNWRAGGLIEATLGDEVLSIRDRGDEWKVTARQKVELPTAQAPVQIVLEGNLNSPPRMFAIDPKGGDKVLLLDPNPALLERYDIARVEPMTWKINDSAPPITGLLCYPIHYQPGKRYPLVIQVVGGPQPFDQFNLYGASYGLGPSPSIYAAQQLANRGIAVLSIKHLSAEPVDVARTNYQAFEAAITKLDSSGVIDKHRVGLVGESRPGWLVAQTITHSQFVYAAAIVSDALDTGYVSGTLSPGNLDRENGGAPFGLTLKNWLERGEGFNADRIRTPLRIEDESLPGGGMLLPWELFSRMRTLNLPVEYYVIPNIEMGSHILQNPKQLLAVKEGAVDWLSFWLQDYEDPDPAKANQYIRWRKLRAQRDIAITVPRPPLLKWSATPVQEY